LAVDRNNPRVAALYSAFHPAVLGSLNYIVKEVSVSDNGTLEIPGIVLGQYQSIYVACAAQVQFSLVGFEEAVTVSAY